jgi:hypothetical protein
VRHPPHPGRLANPSGRSRRPRLRSAAGPVDIEDVRAILQVSGPRLDLPLLRRLARRYGPEEEKALDALLREAGLQAP